MTALNATVQALVDIMNGFFNDLVAAPDPLCMGQTIDKSVILTVHGDTPHTPLAASGWPDATPEGSNWLYVMGNGYLKTGWFGGVKLNGKTDGFDPATGDLKIDQKSTVTSAAAGSAVAYAVAKGSSNLVSQFNGGLPITGLTAIP
jgi:hypothetical protein